MPQTSYKYIKDDAGNVKDVKAYTGGAYDQAATISKYKSYDLDVPAWVSKSSTPTPTAPKATAPNAAPSAAPAYSAPTQYKQPSTPTTQATPADSSATQAPTQSSASDTRGVGYTDYLDGLYGGIFSKKYTKDQRSEYQSDQAQRDQILKSRDEKSIARVVNYLKTIGNSDPTFGDVAWLANKYGVKDYIGTGAQNAEIERKVKLGIQSDQNTGIFGKTTYSGNSIVDYLKNVNQASDFTSRKKLAEQYGIQNYRGTADQNKTLLGIFRKGQTTDESSSDQWESRPETEEKTEETPIVSTSDSWESRPETEEKTEETPIVSTSDSIDEDEKKQGEQEEEDYGMLIDGYKQESEALTWQKKVSDLKEALGVDQAPVQPTLLSTYEALRSDQGITAIESRLNDLDAQTREIEDSARMGVQKEEGRLAPMGLISQRQTAIARQGQEQLDSINRERAILTSELKTKNDMISTYMNLYQQDYSNASTAYNEAFNKNIKVIGLMESYENQAQAEENQVRDDARANLTLMNNMFKDKGLAWEDLDSKAKQQINTLEARSGMPIGTMKEFSNIKPKSNLLYEKASYDKNGNETISFVYEDEDGMPGVVKKVSTGGYKKPTGSGTGDKEIDDYEQAIQGWKDSGISREEAYARATEKLELNEGPTKGLLDKIYGKIEEERADFSLAEVHKLVSWSKLADTAWEENFKKHKEGTWFGNEADVDAFYNEKIKPEIDEWIAAEFTDKQIKQKLLEKFEKEV